MTLILTFHQGVLLLASVLGGLLALALWLVLFPLPKLKRNVLVLAGFLGTTLLLHVIGSHLSGVSALQIETVQLHRTPADPPVPSTTNENP